MSIRISRFLASLCALVLCSCASPQAVAQSPASEATLHWSQVLRGYLQQVNQIDWMLARIALPLCADPVSGHGILFDSLNAYEPGDRKAIAAALDLGFEPEVAAVAKGGPADRAGMMPKDRLMAINGSTLSQIAGKPAAEVSPEEASRMLAMLGSAAPSEITVMRGGEILVLELTPVARCGVATMLTVDKDVEAYSDSRNVAISTGLVRFAANDAELALIVGHEMAHVLLRERHETQAIRGKRKEDEADALGAQLAHCAGYDVALATDFWNRFHDARLFPWLPGLSHRSGKKRERQLGALAETLSCERVGSVVAGWR